MGSTHASTVAARRRARGQGLPRRHQRVPHVGAMFSKWRWAPSDRTLVIVYWAIPPLPERSSPTEPSGVSPERWQVRHAANAPAIRRHATRVPSCATPSRSPAASVGQHHVMTSLHLGRPPSLVTVRCADRPSRRAAPGRTGTWSRDKLSGYHSLRGPSFVLASPTRPSDGRSDG